MNNPANKLQLEEITCPLCGADENRHVINSGDNQWGVAGQFTVVECTSCRHRFMNPRPTIACLTDCYPSDYGPHQLLPQQQPNQEEETVTAEARVSKSVEQPSPRPWYLRYLPLKYIPGLRSFYFWLVNERSQIVPQPFLAKSLSTEQKAPPRAFELGCAAGAYLAQLKACGWEVAGVEPGDGPAATAQAAGLNVHHGTLDSAEQTPAAFDFAASWMVLEHVPNPRATLTQLHELLKPGGQLAISVPNAGCWEPKFFKDNWDAWDLPRHLQHFRPQSIRQLLLDCGFIDIQITHQKTLLNIFGSLGISITKRWPNSRLGNWFLRYPHSPKLAVQLAAAPLAHGLAFFRQAGRLTVMATRPADERPIAGRDLS